MQEYIMFNENEYMNGNSDLKKYSSRYKTNTLKREKLWRHWCVFGKPEGRKYTPLKITDNVSKEYFENNYIIFITRNIIDDTTEQYWRISYNKIRKHYGSIKIIIIDDNSNKKYINDDIKDVEYIYTDHIGRGELLPYYYYLRNNRGKKYAIMLHDSVFLEDEIHKYIKENEYIPLWHFLPETEMNKNRINIQKILNGSRDKGLLMNKFEERDWRGVFGCMSIISHELLVNMNNKIDLFDILIKNVKNRDDRKACERIFSLALRSINVNTYSSLLGNIHHWCKLHYRKYWEITLHEYKKSNIHNECLLTKIWTGR